MSRKALYITLLAVVVLFYAYEEISLRPYLFRHHITAFYIADSLPNFLAVLLWFLVLSVYKYPFSSTDGLKASIGLAGVFTLYECIQPFMDGRTFDLKDIAASWLGAVFCFVLTLGINKIYGEPVVAKT